MHVTVTPAHLGHMLLTTPPHRATVVPDARRGGSAASWGPVLPTAPTNDEKYLYLQPQRRQLVLGQTIASVSTSVVLSVFFIQHPPLVPFTIVTVLNILYALMSAMTGMRTRRVSLQEHVTRVSNWVPDFFPAVDVYLPSAGEPMDVLDNTYRHVAALQWGGVLRVIVLDDSARTDVELLALQYGFEYLSRPDRGRMKKAGNLLHGYQNSNGDFIAVFDADFCPRSDFLYELMPYFDEPDVGIVQSPQYFRTHGTINWLQSAAGSVQEIFYRWVQPSRDGADGAICVGTSAVYRRAGLDRCGGFAQIGHSEDVHTGVNLIKAGFRTCYVPVVVSAGLCPDNYAGFLSQQYRWCAGSMSLLGDTSFHGASLTLAQRACFFTGFLYYISTAVTFFGGPAAAAVLIWVLPEQVWPLVYLPLIAASWCIFFAWKCVLTSRWNLSVVRVQLLYSAAHAFAIWHCLRGRPADWVPTGSATSGASLSTRISRLATGWLVAIEIVLLSGAVWRLYQYGLERFWLSLTLAIFGAIIVIPILRPLRVTGSPSAHSAPTSATAAWTWLAAAMFSLASLPLALYAV